MAPMKQKQDSRKRTESKKKFSDIVYRVIYMQYTQ